MSDRLSLPAKLPGLRRIFSYLWPDVRQHRVLLTGALAALLLQAILQPLEAWPLKYVLDYVFGARRRGRLPEIPGLDGLTPAGVVGLAAVAVVVITGLRELAEYANAVGFAALGNRVLTAVRGRVYRHLQGLPLAYHDKARGGDLVVRVIGDVNQFKNVVIDAALPLAAHLVVLVFMAGVMLWLNWRLALGALATLPLFWYFTARLTRRVQEAARAQRKRDGAMAATAAETLGAMKVVQALALEERFAEEFDRLNAESRREDFRALRWAAALRRAVGFLIAAIAAGVLWYGADLVIRGELTPGELVVFLSYMRASFKPIQEFARLTGRLAKATAAGERVLAVLTEEPAVRDLPGAVPAPPLRGAVRFEGVSFAYGPGRPALEGVDFAAEPGQRVALVGPSGAGKSTLTGLLLRLFDPERGRVLVDGRDVRGYTLASLRGQVCVVLQETVLFAASVRDNIAYGAPGAGLAEVEAAARLSNADEFIRALPEGYDTVLGERGVTLSGGQRQRIALARAAVRRAPILVLDEPTTGLDGENERAVLEALGRLAAGRTTFVVAHDLRQAAGADLILYLERGRLVERGTHAELVALGGRYAAEYARGAGGRHAARVAAG